MRFALRVLLLWTAGLLLFAHSVVPHAHESDYPGGSGKGNWVAAPASGEPLPIEVDLGSDHLEHFRLDDEDNTALGAFVSAAAVPLGLKYVCGHVPEECMAQLGFFPPLPELRTLPFAACAGIRPPPALL
jgi:hypothetical protein